MILRCCQKIPPSPLGLGGVWAAPDRPLEERVTGSYLLSLKKLLVDWAGYGGREVRVDTEARPMTMAVEDGESAGRRKVVGTARLKDGEMAMTWLDPYWTGWSELMNSLFLTPATAAAAADVAAAAEAATIAATATADGAQ